MKRSKAVFLRMKVDPVNLIGGHVLSGYTYGKAYFVLRHNTRTGYCIVKDGNEEWLSHSVVRKYFRKEF